MLALAHGGLPTTSQGSYSSSRAQALLLSSALRKFHFSPVRLSTMRSKLVPGMSPSCGRALRDPLTRGGLKISVTTRLAAEPSAPRMAASRLTSSSAPMGLPAPARMALTTSSCVSMVVHVLGANCIASTQASPQGRTLRSAFRRRLLELVLVSPRVFSVISLELSASPSLLLLLLELLLLPDSIGSKGSKFMEHGGSWRVSFSPLRQNSRPWVQQRESAQVC